MKNGSDQRVSRPRPLRPAPSARRQVRGQSAHRKGHRAEWPAALWLMLKGYQILGFRLKTPAGEIDILARRGQVLAVVEVKHRRHLDQALNALQPEQHKRLLAAGRALLRSRPSLATYRLRIDLLALAPARFPRHIRGVRSDTDFYHIQM